MIDGKYFDGQEMLIVYAAMELGDRATLDEIAFRAFRLSGNFDLYQYHASRYRASCENLLALKFFRKHKQAYEPTLECKSIFDCTRIWMERVLTTTAPRK